MKRCITNIFHLYTAFILLFLISISSTFGQVPGSFNYQAVLRDGDGKVRENTSVSIMIVIRNGSANGTAVYDETHSVTTSALGLINLKVGSLHPTDFGSIDWSAGTYFIEVRVDGTSMGASQLLSVPYALYAASAPASGLADNSVGSEHIIDYSITESDIDDAVFTGWDQDESNDFSGDYNDLSNRPSSFDDADANPVNEIQSLTLAGNDLSLSRGGGTIVLPAGGSSWTDNGGSYTYSNRDIGINTSTPRSDFEIYNSDGSVQLNHNSVSVRSASNENKVVLTSGSGLPGWVGTYGPDNSVNTVLGYISGNEDNGSIGVLDENSNFHAYMQVSSSSVGILATEGTNGNLNFLVTSMAGYPNSGVAAVYDENNNWQARMYVNSSNQGVLEADLKPFRMAHPNIPGTDIVYVSVEGPEVGAYIRGTAILSNGGATIDFPEHFQIVASDESLTIQVTPLSADSRGLAVIMKNNQGFEVRELFDGTGNYSFDWEAKCIRKGYEDFPVLQDANELSQSVPGMAK